MESRLLQSKICFNCSLGTGLNMRVYEAAASGCVLLTDNWNIENLRLTDFAVFYNSVESMERQITELLASRTLRKEKSEAGVRWAARRNPLWTWSRVVDVALEAAEQARYGYSSVVA
jgi:Glycosyl transferases group 1